ncbi:MAG TPA: four helix bundle protein [Bacteroidales bacterium]|nr:four helix bundle protein [Bacteroidales bacterium]HOX78064.1 four helix bundle protein [Bacteroidales bacterium]HPI84806.1 four helix bundle protein [Bacteroidales bacterium]
MKIHNHEDLEVFQQSFSAAVEIFKLTKTFPGEELFSLTDQIRRSSRSVCANISEAFRKRYYPKSFTAKITDAEGEAAETQVWLKFCLHFSYIEQIKYNELMEAYNNILGKLVVMRNNPNKWSIDH